MSEAYELVEVLLVEDNPGDVRLTREALTEGKIRNQLSVVDNGEDALAFLYRRPPHENAPRPDIILLDINLPRKNGLEVLAVIKNDPDLRRIPVVVLTTSAAEQDVLRSYDLHANCYITKPVDLDHFLMAMRQVDSFWVGVVKLPPR